MKILVDTSVWIDFFSRREAIHTECLRKLISSGADICLCGHVLAEVLRGIRHDEQFRKINRRFQVLEFLRMRESTFMLSAAVYRNLRSKGISLKNTVDTFIAAVAIEHQVPLLHNDSDFELISRHYPLKIFNLESDE